MTQMNNIELELEGLQNKIRAGDLLHAFNRYTSTIKVLSIDCFDTLLWRKTSQPTDVFFDLQNKSLFQASGFSASLRISSEKRARSRKSLLQGINEVSLCDIYREFNPDFTEEELQQLIAEELDTENDYCYGFEPVIALIREAHAAGIKIIIVSDTYFNENELYALLSKALPADILAAIDKIFCSSTHKRSKADGLFIDVVQSLNILPTAILHIGDNIIADYVAAKKLQLNALHFTPVDEPIADLLRLQSISANIVDSTIRSKDPLFSLFKGIFSNAPSIFNKPDALIGYASLGPVMYAFARFVTEEVEQLKLQGKNPKVVFLMRDGYLPSLACNGLMNKPYGHCVSISRFAAYAASFCKEEDINQYLAVIGNSNRYQDIARQLLLPDKVSEPLINIVLRSPNPQAEFIRLLHRQDILKIIINKSKQYRSRLMVYLKRQANIQKGDTLVFVDLGYSGTAQRLLTPFLNEVGIDVVGRYLIALRTPGWEKNYRGLLDPSWCDDRILQMLVSHVALLEQLCTSNEKSVINYSEEGEPLYADLLVSPFQHHSLEHIQAASKNFISDATVFFQTFKNPITLKMLKQSALVELCRMMFLPTEFELNHMQNFQFDLNMGTNDILRLFDPVQGLAGLKRRGLFYMDKISSKARTNYPAELRAAGFELAVTSMVQNRFAVAAPIPRLAPVTIATFFIHLPHLSVNALFP